MPNSPQKMKLFIAEHLTVGVCACVCRAGATSCHGQGYWALVLCLVFVLLARFMLAGVLLGQCFRGEVLVVILLWCAFRVFKLLSDLL